MSSECTRENFSDDISPSVSFTWKYMPTTGMLQLLQSRIGINIHYHTPAYLLNNCKYVPCSRRGEVLGAPHRVHLFRLINNSRAPTVRDRSELLLNNFHPFLRLSSINIPILHRAARCYVPDRCYSHWWRWWYPQHGGSRPLVAVQWFLHTCPRGNALRRLIHELRWLSLVRPLQNERTPFLYYYQQTPNKHITSPAHHPSHHQLTTACHHHNLPRVLWLRQCVQTNAHPQKMKKGQACTIYNYNTPHRHLTSSTSNTSFWGMCASNPHLWARWFSKSVT